MTNKEFQPLVDNLLAKAKSIKFEDYVTAISTIREFKNFVGQYSENLSQYVLEYIGTTEYKFKAARDTQSYKTWQSAMDDLLCDIASMKDENKFSRYD